MGTLKGSFNRKTGKTTPRLKGKTHWGGGMSAKRSSTSTKAGKPAASKSAAAKK